MDRKQPQRGWESPAGPERSGGGAQRLDALPSAGYTDTKPQGLPPWGRSMPFNSLCRRKLMATDPNSSLPATSTAEPLPAEIRQALASGVGDFSLREPLGWLLSSVGLAERQAYLERVLHDDPTAFMSAPCSSVPFLSRSGSLVPAPAISARLCCRRPISAATAKQFKPCCWGCWLPADPAMPPRMPCRKMGFSSSQ
jgi:hypothetical protein